MKWFKHICASYNDEKLSLMTDELGMEGYGFWWRTLEVIAEKMDETNNYSCTFSSKKWGTFYGFSAKKFEKFARIFEKFGLLFVEISENSITISVPNLLKYKDEWSKRKAKNSVATSETLCSKEKEVDKEKEYIKESKDSSSKSGDSDTSPQPEQVELVPVPQGVKKPEVPHCPQTEIVQLFKEVLPELPQARTWDNDRQKSLRARWVDVCVRKNFTTKEQGMAWFKMFFQYVRESDFLMGKVPGHGDRTFTANLPWLIGRQNFAKVLDGNYHEAR